MSGLELLLQAAGCSDDGASSIDSAVTTGSTDHKYMILNHPNFVTVKSLHPRSPKTSLPLKKRMKLNSRACCVMGESESFRLQSSDTSLPSLGMSVASFNRHGSGYTDSPSVNSEWTGTMATETMGHRQREMSSSLLQPCNSSAVVPKKWNARDGEKGNGSNSPKRKSNSLKRQLSNSINANKAANNNKKASFVKDMNGNDICMGYFSTPTHHKSQPAEVQIKWPTTGANPQDASDKEEEQKNSIPADNIPTMPRSTKTTTTVKATLEKSERNDACIAAKLLLYQAYLQFLNQSMNQ